MSRDELITIEDLAEASEYAFNRGPTVSRETVGKLVSRLGDLMTQNAELLEKVDDES